MFLVSERLFNRGQIKYHDFEVNAVTFNLMSSILSSFCNDLCSTDWGSIGFCVNGVFVNFVLMTLVLMTLVLMTLVLMTLVLMTLVLMTLVLMTLVLITFYLSPALLSVLALSSLIRSRLLQMSFEQLSLDVKPGRRFANRVIDKKDRSCVYWPLVES